MNLQDCKIIFAQRVADNALILAQRLSTWSGHAPILEEDIAMSNMALDLIGQTRGFYSYAAALENNGKTEDDYAFLRGEREFMNFHLVEQPDEKDFAIAMVRSFFASTYSYLLFRGLINSSDADLSALANKSIKEVTYHVRHCSQWIIRLGDGTAFSHEKTQSALNILWSYVNELFEQDEVNDLLIKNGVVPNTLTFKDEWMNMIKEVVEKATLQIPSNTIYHSTGGIKGVHSEYMGYILAEMQSLTRAFPDAKW